MPHVIMIMENSMKDKILTGTMTDVETGETTNIEPSYWFSNGCELNAIVKILCVVDSRFNPEASPPGLTNIDCLALDCQGNVFRLALCFLPECLEEEQKIISDFTEGKILVVSGRYCVLPKEESVITIYDAKYFPLPTEHSLEEVEEVFRFNSASMIKDIHKAAEQGDIGKQIELGYMYITGYGVSQDFAEAAKWYRNAAEQGDAGAQAYLGDMYREGKGVQQDYDEAIKWYRMAAEQGQADAQLELDKMNDK
jgi:hypothetical protein